MPERLKEGHYYELIMGVMDAEEEEDQNALGIVSIGLIVVENCTINCPDIVQGYTLFMNRILVWHQLWCYSGWCLS